MRPIPALPNQYSTDVRICQALRRQIATGKNKAAEGARLGLGFAGTMGGRWADSGMQ